MGTFFRALYNIANREERLMMVIGGLLAITAGFCIPLNALLMGDVINIITFAGTNRTGYENVDLNREVFTLSLYEVAVASVSFFSCYGAVTLWSLTGSRLGAKVRRLFFLRLMRQSLGWFEVNKMDEIIERFEIDILRLDKGLGDRVPMCLQWLITWVSSYVVAFIESWKLSVLILFFSPLVFIINRFITRNVSRMAIQNHQARVTAGLLARDILAKVRTVHAFHTMDIEARRYVETLRLTKRKEMQNALIYGLGSAYPWVVSTLSFVFIFGYGHYLVNERNLPPGNIFTIFVGVLFALAAVPQVMYHLDAITAASNSIPPVLEVLDLISHIDCFSDLGIRDPKGLKGNIDFRGVYFRFPNNIRVKVLDGLNLHIKAGDSVAMLGNMFSGIMAIPKLIQRFYDVNKGQVMIDGLDIREYNVKWLRSQISYITHNTAIFPISIADNIRIGHADITQDQIEAAARDADLHDFVTKECPKGYDTIVNEIIAQIRPETLAIPAPHQARSEGRALGAKVDNPLKNSSSLLSASSQISKVSLCNISMTMMDQQLVKSSSLEMHFPSLAHKVIRIPRKPQESSSDSFQHRKPRVSFLHRVPRASFIHAEPRASFLQPEPRASLLQPEPGASFQHREPKTSVLNRKPKTSFLHQKPKISFSQKNSDTNKLSPVWDNPSSLSSRSSSASSHKNLFSSSGILTSSGSQSRLPSKKISCMYDRQGKILWTDTDEQNQRKRRGGSMKLSVAMQPASSAATETTRAKSSVNYPQFVKRVVFDRSSSQTAIAVSTSLMSSSGSDAPHTISLTHGQRLQVVIARALVSRPALLILEDFFGYLNPNSLKILLRRLNSGAQTTILMTKVPSNANLMKQVVVVAKGKRVPFNGKTHARLIVEEVIRERTKAARFLMTWKKMCTTGKSPSDIFYEAVEEAYANHLNNLAVRAEMCMTAMKQFRTDYDIFHTVVKKYKIVSVFRRLGLDVLILAVALILSLALGLTHTFLAFCVGHFMVHWFQQLQGKPTILGRVTPEMIIFIAIGCTIFVINLRILSHACFSIANTRLTARMRALMFEALLKQDIQYFDHKENSPVSLAHSLTHDPGLLAGMVGLRVGAFLEALSTLVAGFTLALISEWHTALLLSLVGPLAFMGTILKGAVHRKAEKSYDKFMTEASEVFMEAVENIRIIFNLNMKEVYMNRLDGLIEEGRRCSVKYAHFLGLGHATISVTAFVGSGLFLIAFDYNIVNTENFPRAFIAFSYLVFGMAGVDLSLPLTYLVIHTRAKDAAGRIFKLIDSPAMLNPHTGFVVPRSFLGLVNLELVNFCYPSKPHTLVLNDVTLQIRPGHTTALAGPSGCGKSTILRLILNFYPVYFGSLKVDGIPMKEVNLDWWRRQVCLLQDDPDLIGETMKEVITYGDTRKDIPMKEVEEAAKTAGIHQFIMELPRGYYTGFNESGNNTFTSEQRLRLALARTVFQKPRLLLIDNITKSLQPNASGILETLEKVMKERTCVIATSYLMEIKEADMIVMMSNGRVIEKGTHEQLMALKGCYFMILKKQELEHTKLSSTLQKMEIKTLSQIHTSRAMAKSLGQKNVGKLKTYSTRLGAGTKPLIS